MLGAGLPGVDPDALWGMQALRSRVCPALCLLVDLRMSVQSWGGQSRGREAQSRGRLGAGAVQSLKCNRGVCAAPEAVGVGVVGFQEEGLEGWGRGHSWSSRVPDRNRVGGGCLPGGGEGWRGPEVVCCRRLYPHLQWRG